MKKNYTFESKVLLWPTETAAWHFILLPKKESRLWREKYKGLHRGWNSLKVNISLGKTKWNTSIFFDTKSTCYILPLKAQVRKAEQVYADDLVKFKLTLV